MVVIVWYIGFVLAAIAYYWGYRDKGPTLPRMLAAMCWPVWDSLGLCLL